jgi:surface protein
MFAYQSDFNEPLTYWNTSSATDMSYMFWEARSFDQNLSHFDSSKVTVMNHMFKYATVFKGVGLERWNVARVQQFYKMFDNVRISSSRRTPRSLACLLARSLAH